MRRLISLVISVSLIFGMMIYSSPISAEGVEESRTVNEENAAWLKSLGVETSLSGEYVTRSEFVVALIRLLHLDKSSASAACFSDVSSTTELGAAVEAALALNLISKADSFFPAREISYSEASKMAVTALGYAFEAERFGGYPSGYLQAANKLKLTAGAENNRFNQADYVDFLTSMTNSVVRNEASVSQYGADYTEGGTFAEKYHNLKTVEGIVEANEHTYIYTAAKAVGEGQIVIDGVTYFVSEDDYPLGYYAYGYADQEDNIVFLWFDKTDVTRVTSVQLPEYSNGVLSYYVGNDKEELALDKDVLYLKNGKAVTNGTDHLDILDGYIECISNDRNDDIDVVKIYESSFITVGTANVSAEIISDRNTSKSIQLANKEYRFQGTTFDKLSAGMVLEYYVSPDGGLYDFRLCADTLTGTIKEIASDGTALTIEDGSYEVTEYFTQHYSSSVLPGSTVKVYFSCDGKIVTAESSSGSSMSLGYLFKFSHNSSSLDKTYQLKLYTENGDISVMTLADKVELNGTSKSAAEVYKALSANGEMPIRYTETDGVIKKIVTSTESEDFYDVNQHGVDALVRYQYKDYDTETKIPYNTNGYFVPFFFVNDNTVIFSVKSVEKESDEKKRFTVGSGSGFLYGIGEPMRKSVQAYNVSDTGYAGCVVYKDDGSRDSYLGSLSAPHAIVASVSKILGADEEIVWELTLYWANQYFKVYVDPDADYVKNANFKKGYEAGQPPFTPGDYIRYKLNGNEMIYATKSYDYKNNINNGYQKEHNIDLNFYNGDLVKASSGTVAIHVTQGSGDNGSVCYFILPSTIVLVKRNGVVVTRPSSEIASYIDNPNCDGVLVTCQNSNTKAVVVYEK